MRSFLSVLMVCLAISGALSAEKNVLPINSYMCNDAELIVLGTVASVGQIPLERRPSADIIASVGKKNVIHIKKFYKGMIKDKSLIILTQGGTMPDDIEMNIVDEPVFHTGDTMLIFLVKRTFQPFWYEVLGRDKGCFVLPSADDVTKAEKILQRYLRF